jgi:nucleotidyltransferase/DNA polymerase involved in DNA repair
MNVNTARVIVHVDMDAFYAAIEQLDNPEYRGRPVVVGADPRGGRGRGVVSAASYEARTFGIRSAMPISQAYRRCPHAVFATPRMDRYVEMSSKVMKVLSEFTPLVEPLSIDEAFLDCSGTEKLTGPPGRVARFIKERIYSETLLTASVGVAGNKSVAKIASELGKPDGLVLCPPGMEREFLSTLPLRHLWGAGGKTLEKLASLGFSTIGHVAEAAPEFLARVFGRHGRNLWELANGIDDRDVVPEWERKSISEETTFERDVSSAAYIEHVLFRIADSLTRDMRRQNLRGRTVTLKIRLEGFETFTRSRTLPAPVNDTESVRATARDLFRNFDRRGKKVRLVGIGLSNLGVSEGPSGPSDGQLELFDEGREGLPAGQDPAAGGASPETGVSPEKRISDSLLDSMKKIYGEKITRAAFLRDKTRRFRE